MKSSQYAAYRPGDDLIFDGSTFYGTTKYGGDHRLGTIFALRLPKDLLAIHESIALPIDAVGDSIEGVWQVVSSQRDGKPLGSKGNSLYRFQEGRLTVQTEGKPSADIRSSVDTGETPHNLDLELQTGKGTRLSLMIFQVDGDELVV